MCLNVNLVAILVCLLVSHPIISSHACQSVVLFCIVCLYVDMYACLICSPPGHQLVYLICFLSCQSCLPAQIFVFVGRFLFSSVCLYAIESLWLSTSLLCPLAHLSENVVCTYNVQYLL